MDAKYDFPSPANWLTQFEFRNSDFMECPKKEMSPKFSEYHEIDLFESFDENAMAKFNYLEFLQDHAELPLSNLSDLEITDPIFSLPPFEPALIPNNMLNWTNDFSSAPCSFIPENEADMLPQYFELEPFYYADSIVEKIEIKKISSSFFKMHVDTLLDPNCIIFGEKQNSNWDISNVIEYYDPKYTSLPGIYSFFKFKHRIVNFFQKISHQYLLNRTFDG